MPSLLFCQCSLHSYHFHKCWNCTAVWYSCQLVAKMSCSLYATMHATYQLRQGLQIWWQPELSQFQKVIAMSSASTSADSRFSHSDMWWCAHCTAEPERWRQGYQSATVCTSLSYWKHCHDTKCHGGPDMLGVYKRHVSGCTSHKFTRRQLLTK